MLKLLSILDASLVIYLWERRKDWKLAFDPETRKAILGDNTELINVLVLNEFIKNAIKADELPAKEVLKGKVADKQLFEAVGKELGVQIPENFYSAIKQSDYWIVLEDLFTFMEKKPMINPKSYAHGRDALARLLCILIDKKYLNEKDIIEHLDHQIETVEAAMNTDLMLKENTLKGCCREILDAYSTLKTKSLKEN